MVVLSLENRVGMVDADALPESVGREAYLPRIASRRNETILMAEMSENIHSHVLCPQMVCCAPKTAGVKPPPYGGRETPA